MQADIKEFFDSIRHDVIFDALEKREVPEQLQAAYAKEYLGLLAQARIRDSERTNKFDFAKGARTGGVEAPLLSSEVLEAELGPLFVEWEQSGIGFRLSNAGDEEVVTVSHILWADNIYLFAADDKMADFMLRGVTRVLVDKLKLCWKTTILEAMHGAH